MVKPADKMVSLAELRFKPANSNDAARAVFSHHFVNVPRCSYARDDGISHYLGSETGMETFPASPGIDAPRVVDVPEIRGEPPEASGSPHRKLLRGGFALSVFLHAAAAIAIGYATLTLPDDADLEEGTLSVTLVVEGNAETDARAAGAAEEVEKSEDNPVEKQPAKPVEKAAEEQQEPVKQPDVQKPRQVTTETILKDVPMPVPDADLPDILTALTEAEATTETAAKSPSEEKAEPSVAKPVEQEKEPVEKKAEEQPKPVEQKAEPQKQEPKKQPEKKKPTEKRKQNRGDQGEQASNARKGEVDADNKGKASTNSRGDSPDKEVGNAARSNYKGLVYRKLARAKGRIQSPAKGKVTVTFTVLANGAISGLKVTQSSGKPAIDSAALKIVRTASPFPPIPSETGWKSRFMIVPITFK
jgi:protein TonB